MSTAETPVEALLARPKRADARRNYDKVLATAREAFAEGGEATSLEEIARRAEVGIGTLYRHFPNRQALLEAVYVNEVEEVARSAEDFEDGDPWESLNGWFERVISYFVAKRALSAELMDYLAPDSPLFTTCRACLLSAGEPLLKRAQEAGVVRTDVEFWDVMHMLGGIAKMPLADREQVDRVLRVALDGLRYRPES